MTQFENYPHSIYTNLIMISVFVIIGCEAPAKIKRVHKDSITRANENLTQAHSEYLDEVNIFRINTLTRLDFCTMNLNTHKSTIDSLNKRQAIKSEKTILDFDLRINKLRSLLNNYEEYGGKKWALFQTDFTNDLEKLEVDMGILDLNPLSTKSE